MYRTGRVNKKYVNAQHNFSIRFLFNLDNLIPSRFKSAECYRLLEKTKERLQIKPIATNIKRHFQYFKTVSQI